MGVLRSVRTGRAEAVPRDAVRQGQAEPTLRLFAETHLPKMAAVQMPKWVLFYLMRREMPARPQCHWQVSSQAGLHI